MSGASLHLADTPPAPPNHILRLWICGHKRQTLCGRSCCCWPWVCWCWCVCVCARHIQGALHRLLNFINTASSFARSISTWSTFQWFLWQSKEHQSNGQILLTKHAPASMWFLLPSPPPSLYQSPTLDFSLSFGYVIFASFSPVSISHCA